MGYLPYEFLLADFNHRTDDYGGSVNNRVRFVRELIEATKDAVGDKCGIALRISLEELRAKPSDHFASEAHEVVSLLSDLPDLWDVKMDSSPTDCGASRFRPEGAHEPIIDFVKKVTDKPVVGVGRFTSPDTMVSQIKRGVLDLIGGARPSIADPFLPIKIREGREDEIRECIGCNICIARETLCCRYCQGDTYDVYILPGRRCTVDNARKTYHKYIGKETLYCRKGQASPDLAYQSPKIVFRSYLLHQCLQCLDIN